MHHTLLRAVCAIVLTLVVGAGLLVSAETLDSSDADGVSSTYAGIDDTGDFVLFADQHSFGGDGIGNHSDWKYRVIMGQQIIGNAYNNEFDVDFGYIYMLNFRPTFAGNFPAVSSLNRTLALVKQPYTNDSLVCEVNFTEYDVGDTITAYFTWYRNSSNWYNNSEEVLYNETEALAAKYATTFAPWTTDNESINVSSVGATSFTVNTTVLGNIEPEDTEHYELWKCSVRLFDQLMYSWTWINSTPIMVYNHPPDYNHAMPTYYNWTEDSTYTIDLGSNFSDIDTDDINWYINSTSTILGQGYVHPSNITISIDNETGIVTLTPHANITGIMYINFTAVDNNHTITNHSGGRSNAQDWYLRNTYGHTTTALFLLNITQVNDPPWATNVYIDPTEPSYTSTLTCEYSFQDLENHPENTTDIDFKWYLLDEGSQPWTELGVNSSTLTSDYFDLDDFVICSVRVKDVYYDYADWGGEDNSLQALEYVNSSAVYIGIEEDSPAQEEQIVIGVG